MRTQVELTRGSQYRTKRGVVGVLGIGTIEGREYCRLGVGTTNGPDRFTLHNGESHTTDGFGTITLDNINLSTVTGLVTLTIGEDE